CFFFSSRRRHTRSKRDWSSDVCSSDLLYSGAVFRCCAAILCTGTYLKARCIYGDVSTNTGPNGLQAANHLTECLKELGIKMYRRSEERRVGKESRSRGSRAQ